jgi:hypothetical protein
VLLGRVVSMFTRRVTRVSVPLNQSLVRRWLDVQCSMQEITVNVKSRFLVPGSS